MIAIIAFVLSSGQIVLQSFQHHHAVNPKHGFVKFAVFLFSCLSLIYLAKDIYADFEQKATPQVLPNTLPTQAELDYWHQIYNNPSPERYCDYLDKFPMGQFIEIAKNGVPNRDCIQLKQQIAEELRKKNEAEALALKEKLEQETKALAEKNAQLEKEAQENAARIAALEQATTIAEKDIKIPVPKIVEQKPKSKSHPLQIHSKLEKPSFSAPEPLPTLPIEMQSDENMNSKEEMQSEVLPF